MLPIKHFRELQGTDPASWNVCTPQMTQNSLVFFLLRAHSGALALNLPLCYLPGHL